MTRSEVAELNRMLGRYAADHATSGQVCVAVEVLRKAVRALHGRMIDRCPWCGALDVINTRWHKCELQNHDNPNPEGEVRS